MIERTIIRLGGFMPGNRGIDAHKQPELITFAAHGSNVASDERTGYASLV
jgi:hypothetical protein